MQIPVRPVYPSISQYVATLNNILIVILGFLGVVEITKITFCGLFKKALKTLSLLFLFQIHRIKKLAIKQLIWTQNLIFQDFVIVKNSFPGFILGYLFEGFVENNIISVTTNDS